MPARTHNFIVPPSIVAYCAITCYDNIRYKNPILFAYTLYGWICYSTHIKMNQKINYFSVCQVSKYMFFSVSNVISDVYLFMYHRISCVLFLVSRSFLKPRYAGFMPSAQDFNKCKSHDLTKSKHQLPYSCFNRISSTFRSLSNLQHTTLHTHKLSYQIAKQ